MVVARVEVHLRKGVADPEGDATRKALQLLGFQDVQGVRAVKVFEIVLDETDPETARAATDEMCRKLLANPVIHDYRIEVGTD